MTKEQFQTILSEEVLSYKQFLETSDNEWIIKGFIDVNKNVYTVTDDTKVVSKIIELLLIPKLKDFAQKNGLKMDKPSKQNYYPDLSFSDNEGHKFAVDFKSSYYSGERINGLTLGSYWGYFRERTKKKNTDLPYNAYCSHLVIGVLYKRTNNTEETIIHNIEELSTIHSVIESFLFFVQPKWTIASDSPGSGNTRNIGSITDINKLIKGKGPFAELGEDVFDDYWMGYFNNADAQKAGLGTPRYHNLSSYKEFLKSQADKLEKFK